MYVCVCVCVCVYVHVRVSVYVSEFVPVYLGLHVCECILYKHGISPPLLLCA